jgi:(p)ppGpp synthase/HD superfamily hydrolase
MQQRTGSVDAGELLRAVAFAARKRKDQRRKDVEASPFINHPIAVASVLATEAGVTDGVTLMAACRGEEPGLEAVFDAAVAEASALLDPLC